MVTATPTDPAPAGTVAVIEVAVLAVMVAAFPPKVTALALVRLVPVRVTVVPPVSGPVFGETPLIVGAAA